MRDAPRQPRLSARALVVFERKLLLVNATPDKDDGSWCTPGGGVDAGRDLRENLRREILEETGLEAEIGDIVAVSEFFDRAKDFHQVDLFFRGTVAHGRFPAGWTDIANVVEQREFFALDALTHIEVFPCFLRDGFWLNEGGGPLVYRGSEEKS